MGKLIVIAPQTDPVVVEHEGEVTLEDIKRHIGDITVDVSRLGTIPPVGRHADLWIDDEGLLNDAKPNRHLPNGAVICGTMMICAGDDAGQSLPFDDAEAAFVLKDIGDRWAALPADHQKPEPGFTVTVLE